MEKHCSTISFWLKKRTDKNGKSPITMVIAANGERTEFQTGRKIEPENWDNAKQQAKGKTFGRQVYNMNSENSELALVKLMELFNHSSVAITKRYLGLRQEEILETYDCLTF